MDDKPVAEQIDDIILKHSGWKGQILTSLRAAITQADPAITEEIKWRMAKRPEGLAVWMCSGIVCFAEIWKDNIKLLFPDGAKLQDPAGYFNARLLSAGIRAIEFRDGDQVDSSVLQALVHEAIAYNNTKTSKKS